MALKAVHVSDVPTIDRVQENAALALSVTSFFKDVKGHDGNEVKCRHKFQKFVVMGHRGCGMNMMQSSDPRMKTTRENSFFAEHQREFDHVIQCRREVPNRFHLIRRSGSEIYVDIRRNSLDEAIKVCLTGGLQGIVSKVTAILRNPEAVTRIKESKLSLVTYGQLNNLPRVVYMQHLTGVDGVIVDFVQEITEAISYYFEQAKEENGLYGEEGWMQVKTNPGFLQQQLYFASETYP